MCTQKIGGKLEMANAHKSFENQTTRERHADLTSTNKVVKTSLKIYCVRNAYHIRKMYRTDISPAQERSNA